MIFVRRLKTGAGFLEKTGFLAPSRIGSYARLLYNRHASPLQNLGLQGFSCKKRKLTSQKPY